MRLFRYGDPGNEKPGILYQEKMYDVSAFGETYNEHFFESDGVSRLRLWVQNNLSNLKEIDSGLRLGAPIERPSKLICIGLNYSDHAKETGGKIPEEPVVFFKATSAIVGPNDGLTLPRNSTHTDWEVELAVVVSKRASYISLQEAPGYIAGYCLHNDYSEREYQLHRSGQWVKGKSCDTFAPLGPFLVTPDELAEIQNIPLWLTVNGEMMQNGSTSDMIFTIPFIVSYLSQFMTLLPGDVISTGTPAGVGMGMSPKRFLREGDIVVLGAEGLGEQRQEVHQYI